MVRWLLIGQNVQWLVRSAPILEHQAGTSLYRLSQYVVPPNEHRRQHHLCTEQSFAQTVGRV